MQPRWYYKSILQAGKCQVLAYEGQRHAHASMHASVHASAHASARTHVTCRIGVRIDAQLFSIAEVKLLKTQVHPLLCGVYGMS